MRALSVAKRAVPVLAAVALVLLIPRWFSDAVLPLDSLQVQEFGGDPWAAYLGLTIMTVLRSMAFFALAFIASFIVAASLAIVNSGLARAVETASNGLRFLPAVAWLPVTISLLGVSSVRAQVTFVLLGVAPVCLFYLVNGFRSCPVGLSLLGDRSEANRFRRFWLITLPSARDSCRQAARLGVGLAFILTVVHEYIVPSISGVSRVVEVGEILRYTTSDGALFTALLASIGVLLDSACLGVFAAAWALGSHRQGKLLRRAQQA